MVVSVSDSFSGLVGFTVIDCDAFSLSLVPALFFWPVTIEEDGMRYTFCLCFGIGRVK